MKTKGLKIDVQHHITPKEYVEKLASIGITESYGQSIPDWSPKDSLSFMKKLGIDIAIMSISTPGVYLEDDKFSKDLARMCNEHMAEVKTKYPGKFGGFASIPLPDAESSLSEIKYAFDELELDGICLMSSYKGKYLGNEQFEEVFKELNRRKMVVFIHPTDPVGAYDPELELSNALIEAPFETTRAVTNLIYTGTADRYPNIKYILAHGGGTIPYLAWKIALIEYGQKGKKTPVLKALYDLLVKGAPEAGLKILKNMYYDTAVTSGPYALMALREFAGSSHIVFGSDFPFAKVASIVDKNLKKYGIFSDEEMQEIYSKNCLQLFPQFKNVFE